MEWANYLALDEEPSSGFPFEGISMQRRCLVLLVSL